MCVGAGHTAARCSAERRSTMSTVRRHLAALSRLLCRPFPVLLVFAALWAVFLLGLHPWLMNWGATSEEQAMPLPGDTVAPSAYFTRAITIVSPPSAVWPWLLQIGQDRAGFYSNDWL